MGSSDLDVGAGRTGEYEKQTMGVCCAGCVGKFESDPKKYIGKVKEFKKKSSSLEEISFDDAINKKCPLTGKDVVAGRTVEYEKQASGFCGAGWVGKFEADPMKYIGKGKEFKKKSSAREDISFDDALTQNCPRTGQDVVAGRRGES